MYDLQNTSVDKDDSGKKPSAPSKVSNQWASQHEFGRFAPGLEKTRGCRVIQL